MSKYPNTCARCGQALDLVDEPYSEYRSVKDSKNNELCPRCYQALIDKEY